MSKQDGGPAFPVPEQHGQQLMRNNEWEQAFESAYQGMSLRDYFAGQALAGMLADPNSNVKIETTSMDAYRYADAMIEARAK